jgi:hypothetical protein
MTETLFENSHDAITELLIGRKVEKVDAETLRLDNGVRLRLRGNEGGCSCGAGDYELTELNGVDNVITNVEFVDSPSGEDRGGRDLGGDGVYRIFVFADNERINLATFEGSDGNGYYGTGYSIEVLPPEKP